MDTRMTTIQKELTWIKWQEASGRPTIPHLAVWWYLPWCSSEVARHSQRVPLDLSLAFLPDCLAKRYTSRISEHRVSNWKRNIISRQMTLKCGEAYLHPADPPLSRVHDCHHAWQGSRTKACIPKPPISAFANIRSAASHQEWEDEWDITMLSPSI